MALWRRQGLSCPICPRSLDDPRRLRCDIHDPAPGGSVITVSPDGVAVGSWATTGQRTADIVIRSRPPDGIAGGYTIRGSLEVSEDGARFTGTYTFEPSPELAEVTGMAPGSWDRAR